MVLLFFYAIITHKHTNIIRINAMILHIAPIQVSGIIFLGVEIIAFLRSIYEPYLIDLFILHKSLSKTLSFTSCLRISCLASLNPWHIKSIHNRELSHRRAIRRLLRAISSGAALSGGRWDEHGSGRMAVGTTLSRHLLWAEWEPSRILFLQHYIYNSLHSFSSQLSFSEIVSF